MLRTSEATVICGLCARYMTLTMVFGSFIAGSTSEGGAAVAFPVLTLLFKVKVRVASAQKFARLRRLEPEPGSTL